VVGCLLAAGPAGASELAGPAAAAAFAHYRGARFYLRTGNPGLAELELDGMAERWRALRQRFADRPPDVFADDPAWPAVLEEVAGRIDLARAALGRGEPGAAAEALDPVRARLSDLRRRNNVLVFADCVDEIGGVMAWFDRFKDAEPDFGAAADLRELRAGAAVLTYLFERCRDRAPADVAKDPRFTRMVDGALGGLERLWTAVEAKDPHVTDGTLRELRSFVRLLVLEFG
jgi:hypothetical protein